MNFCFKIFFTFLIACAIFFGGMVAVFSLDGTNIYKNVQESMNVIFDEGMHPAMGNFGGWVLDNSTDRIMLCEAANFAKSSPLQDAMLNKDIYFNGILPVNDFSSESHFDNYYVYGRYWHGYILTLRPLLMICNYSQIRCIGALALLAGLIFSFIGIRKRCAKIVSWLYLGVMTVAMVPPVFISMQYTTCFLLTFIFISILTFFPSITSDKHRAGIFFFIIGMTIVFFDFLTVPLLTLCFTLTVYCLMRNGSICLKEVVLLATLWFLGYGGLWAAKWLLATMITGQNFFANALNSIFIRTYGEDIIMTYSKWIYVSYYGLLLIFSVFIWICRHKAPVLYRYFYLLFIALLPALWLLVLRSHTLHHFWFTYRGIFASFFPLMIYFINIAHARNSHSYTLS